MREFQLFLVFVVFLLCGVVVGKQCTNGGVGSSHSFRYELLKSKNETWKEEMSSHYHLIHTDDSFWADLMPRKMLKEDVFSWSMMYREMKNPGGFKVGGNFLKEVSLHDVELDPSSFHWRAQQTNLEYLLMLDVDRLVWSFRKTAGLEPPGKSFGGWEETDSELRGHFVGHYLSATALAWASTHNETLKEKMSAVVSELSACQKKIGSGYLSAFPSELFDRFEALEPVWAPYYTIHKILAGLLDQYIFADNAEALNMTTWMVEYFYNRVENVIAKYSVERHWQSLNEETGGMNDVLYKLYAITGNMKHLALAHLFDKPCFLGPLALQADDISGFHSNTHIPIVIGAQMRYEVTGDPLYKTIGTYFMQIVNSSHSYATGGTSVGEFWSDPKRLASTLETENEESCTTYNMLKVSRHLFRWTKEMIYADYYERALTNGVLGIQRGTDPGVMIYMLPLGRGVSKAVSYHGWGTKFDSFWCCYGTGIESFSKLGDSIYFEEDGKVPGIYITQYISSTLDWKSGQLQVTQKVDPVVSWDPFLRISLSFAPKQGTARSSAVNLRIPTWTNLNGAKAELNGQNMPLPAPGKFISITRKWSSSDKLTLQLPITLKTEAIKDDRPEYASIQAILYGPYLLAGHTTGDWDIKTGSDSSDWITPVPAAYNSHLVTFSQKSGNSTFALSSFNQSITMQKLHGPGTIGAGSATFRVILLDTTKKRWTMKNAIGKTVKLEPFDLPGMLLVNQGDKTLGIANSLGDEASSSFRLVAGLDGTSGSVSLESVSQKGCYVHGGVKYKSGLSVKLSCKGESPAPEMNRAASFAMKKGISEYHPINFVAKGVRRNFLLAPLMSFTDEFYSVYFNIQA